MKTKTMKTIGYGCALAIIVGLLIGLEVVIAKIMELSVHGVPYVTYQLNWMRSHPIVTGVEGIIAGIILVALATLFAEMN